jgi:hypothetical protein
MGGKAHSGLYLRLFLELEGHRLHANRGFNRSS